MRKTLFALALLWPTVPLFAQGLEAGEWEFDSTSSSALFPKPQTASFKHCIKKEDAENPERWMGKQNEKSDCKFTPGKRTGESMSWEMHCPKSNMRGSGTAKFDGGTVESEMRMNGDLQGRRFEISTRMTGKRLGPCKS